MADAAGAGEAGAASLGDDFGQRVDLTVRLRELLRSYPEGTSVLRELAQNADDAGARTFALMLDLRAHAAAALLAPSMRALHAAPALLAFNDAAFTARDFAAIQRIGDSLKREDSQGAKTGRFGLGFSSAFHLTDVPSFVSGSSVVFLDPMASHLPGVNPADVATAADAACAAVALVFDAVVAAPSLAAAAAAVAALERAGAGAARGAGAGALAGARVLAAAAQPAAAHASAAAAAAAAAFSDLSRAPEVRPFASADGAAQATGAYSDPKRVRFLTLLAALWSLTKSAFALVTGYLSALRALIAANPLAAGAIAGIVVSLLAVAVVATLNACSKDQHRQNLPCVRQFIAVKGACGLGGGGRKLGMAAADPAGPPALALSHVENPMGPRVLYGSGV